MPKSQFTDWRNTTSLNKFSSALHTCYTKAGGLVIININGLHASTLRTTNRKVIVFEYDGFTSSMYSPPSTVIVPASKLSPKVQQNINLFQCSNTEIRLGTMANLYISQPAYLTRMQN